MKRTGVTLAACAAALAVFTGASAAWAGSWWSSTVGNLLHPCTGGPTTLAAPTGQPVLGENLIVAAPFYTGASSMGILVLESGNGNDYPIWEWINTGCYDLSSKGDNGWGLNVTGAAAYFYAYTSPADATPGKVLSTAATTSDTWAASGWGTEFTSVQVYAGDASSNNSFTTRITSSSPCNTEACIYEAVSGTPALWNPNSACVLAPQHFNAEQVALDYYNGFFASSLVWLSSGGVVQHAGTATFCGGSYTVASSYPMTVCGGGGTLYAVQVAIKDGQIFALGDTGAYTGGLGNIYEYGAGAGCWTLLTGGPSSDTVVSINADNSSRAYTGGGVGAYAVWATDNANKIWAYCTGATCAAPPF